MKSLIVVVLCAQVGIFLATAFTIIFAGSKPDRRRSMWSSLAVSLIIVAIASWQIGNNHADSAGADLLLFGAPLLLGMGIMALLMLLRQPRGLDGPS